MTRSFAFKWSTMFALLVPLIAFAAEGQASRRGLVCPGVGFLIALYLLSKWEWSDDAGQGGMWFRVGVLLVPYIFGWFTLRPGFKTGARIFAFVWMAFTLSTVAIANRADAIESAKAHNAPSQPSTTPETDEIRKALSKGCMRGSKGRWSQQVCDCLGDAFVNEHSLAEVETIANSKNGNYPPSFLDWLERSANRCRAQEEWPGNTGAAAAAPPTAATSPEPQAPTTAEPASPTEAANDEPPPDVAKTLCNLTSSPAGATITVDGKPTGQVTPADVTIYAGRNNLIGVKLSGYFPASHTLSPNLNQHTEHHFMLRPAIELHHAAQPAGTELYVDGEKTGNSPGTTYLEPGKHTLVFKCRTCADVEREIEATTEPITLDVVLPMAAKLKIETYPRGARVSVDGKQVSTAVVSLAADTRHYLTVTEPGFLPVTQVHPAMQGGDSDSITVALEEGSRSDLRACAKKTKATLAKLNKARAKTASALGSAAPSKQKNLQDQLDSLEKELAARHVELEFCSTAR